MLRCNIDIVLHILPKTSFHDKTIPISEGWGARTAAWLAQLVEGQSALHVRGEVEGLSPRPGQHLGS